MPEPMPWDADALRRAVAREVEQGRMGGASQVAIVQIIDALDGLMAQKSRVDGSACYRCGHVWAEGEVRCFLSDGKGTTICPWSCEIAAVERVKKATQTCQP